jgi:hypothetical protein
MKIGRKPAILGVIAVLFLTCVGWFVAGHYATKAARDGVDGFLIRQNLKGVVSYQNISASPFGKTTLTGVLVKIDGIPVKCDEVRLSGIDTDNDVPRGMDVVLSGLDIPALDFARSGNEAAAFFAGLGYTSLHGRLGFSYSLSDKGELSVKTSCDASQAGSWKLKLDLSGIDSDILSALAMTPNVMADVSGGLSGTSGGPSGRSPFGSSWNTPFSSIGVGVQLLKAATAVKLAGLELAVDDSGIYDRMNKLTVENVPSGRNSAGINPGTVVDETSLVKAGMGPSVAKETAAKIKEWLEKGGGISLSTSLDHPLALMHPGGMMIPEPAFDSFASFLVKTKAKVR